MAAIQPLEFPILGTANNLLVRSLPFDMEALNATFYYELQEVSETQTKLVTNGNITMPAEVYDGWGSDNHYVIEWVADYLALTLVD